MLCVKVLELLPRFIENDFSEAEMEEIRRHIETCERCEAEYRAMLSLVDRLDQLPVVGVPSSFKSAIMHRLSKDKQEEEDPSP